MMDYEKKIRDYMNSSDINTLYKSMLSNLFPELCESEDEKTRKEIIYHIKNCDDTIDEETEKRMLAWLEKKGEQKSAWSEDDERHLNTAIAYLKDAQEFKKTAENCIDWLKSLKQRIGGKL